jgi:phosphatidylinositol glycan class B
MSISNKVTFLALIIYCLTAFFSNGYYHYDEHYQIVEFAEYKAGNNHAEDLAWEFGAKIRPALQPMLFYSLAGILRWLNITDHYVIEIIVRLITAFFAVSVIGFFFRHTKHLVDPKLQNGYGLLVFFLWFLPFLNIRFSSENYSGLTFLMGMGVFYTSWKHKWFLIGLFLGLSFLFRFQTAFMSCGFFVWLVVIHKADFKQIVRVVFGGSIAILMGMVVDFWLYQCFVLPFYNYFFFNVVKDVASSFGTSPWYFYFTSFSQAVTFPFAFLLILFFLLYFYLNPKGILTWIIIPFFLIHLLTPHKELRFLFPLANLLPLIVFITLSQLQSLYKTGTKWLPHLKILLVPLIVANLILIGVMMLSPANQDVQIMKFISDNYGKKAVRLFGFRINNLYQPLGHLPQNYYRRPNLRYEEFSDQLIQNKNDSKKEIDLIVIPLADYRNLGIQTGTVNGQPKMVCQTTPGWVSKIRSYAIPESSDNSLCLFEISLNR